MTALMFQGTASNVGKSTIVAGLCRALKKRGLKVLPFKPQNMSNNAAVTACGGEIGRAQFLQALACGVTPIVDMNPVLLKPQADGTSQLIVRGRAQLDDMKHSKEYSSEQLLEIAIESFERLKQQADIVIVEGAGSAAEVNLREGDIANMGFACATQTPVVMIGDIELGGVIASLVGTYSLLAPQERELVRGFVVNKFRGDPDLFTEGLKVIEEKTHWPSFGVLPFMHSLNNLPAEDAASLDRMSPKNEGRLLIAVPHLPHIANFDDLDPLRHEEGVEVAFIPPGQALPGNADLVFIPGTKSTLRDLTFFKEQGWDTDLAAHIRRGGHVLGVCGGFQMLGKEVSDPVGVDGMAGTTEGLGFLDVATKMASEKHVGHQCGRSDLFECDIGGYEIHMGETMGPDMNHAFLSIDNKNLSASSFEGRVLGTYLHGIFGNDIFRRHYLARLGCDHDDQLNYAHSIEQILDELAECIEQNLDVDQILS